MNVLYILIIYPITTLIELVFTFSQKVFKEPAISILAISVVVNLLCLPLYDVAEKWQSIERETVKKLKPKIDKIKAVFSGDERFMLLQIFYRQNNYHPSYALRSTFGLLIQIPFFIAAYSWLTGLEALKGASFLFIPDLGAPDRLLPWGINFLPVLMTATNLIAGALYSRDFPIKEKIQIYGMAAIFLVLLYNSPSGLVIYWTMNNLFSLIKNIFYKIPFKNKKKFAALVFSLFCFFLVFYLLRIYHGAPPLRKLLSAFFIMAGLFPWIFLAGKRIIGIKISHLSSLFSFRADFKLFLFSLISLCCLTGLFLPSMLIGASPQEFSFIDTYKSPLFFIANTFLQAAGFSIVWPLFLYFLFNRKIKTVLSFLGPFLLVCALINIFFFPGNYGLISLELVFNSDISHTAWEIFINFMILSLPVLFVFILYRFNRQKLLFSISLICLVSVTAYSSYNIVKINDEFQKVKGFRSVLDENKTTIKPLFHLSKTGKNTIVIMLDRAISVFIPFIFEENPELSEIYSGFVFYPNTVAFNGYTSIGTPPLFGGYEYTPIEINRRENEPLVAKHNESLLLLPHIYSEAGYSVTVTDPPYPNYSSKDDLQIYDSYSNVNAIVTDSRYTRVWLDENDMSFPGTADILKRNLLWYSLFRMSPLALRSGIYLQGDWCAPSLMQKMTLTLNGYAVLDYLVKFTNIREEKSNTALIMVNNTTHEPSFLQAPDYRPVSAVTNFGKGPFSRETAYHVNVAAIKRLGEWFMFLKDMGVYDNTRIILVSDHGPQVNFLVKSSLPINIEQFNSLLMVKDFNDNFSMKTDFSFMSTADVPFLALNKQIENPVNPFTGKEITMDMKNVPLYIAVSGSIHLESPNTSAYTLNPKYDYYVHTDIFDPSNWKQVITGP